MASTNNTTLTSKATTKINSDEGYAWCSLFVAEALFIITLNTLTMVVFLTKPTLRRRSTYLLINLAATDIGIGAFVMPISIYRRGNAYKLWKVDMTYEWFISSYGIDLFFFGCSLLFLVSISIERLHATTNPFRHRLISASTYKKWIAGVWVASAIYTSFTVAVLHFNLLGLYIWYIVAGCVLVSILILCVSYVAIFFAVRCRKQSETTSRHARKERNLTVTLAIVTLVSMTVWLPYVLFTFLEMKLTKTFSEEALLRVRSVCEVLFFANSFVNPILYTIRMTDFKKAFTTLIGFNHIQSGIYNSTDEEHSQGMRCSQF